MDERDDLYEKIVAEYKKTGSVKKVVENLGSNTIKVRRVLITEGLWESKSSRQVGELFAEGKSVKEIAGILCMSEKNVQSYIPYTRGAYGGTKSECAERSGEYRNRKKQAADNIVSMRTGDNIEEIVDIKEKTKDNILMFPTEVANHDFDDEESYGPQFPSVLRLRFEIVAPYKTDNGMLDMDPDEEQEFLRMAKAEKGIIREVLVPGEMTLHALHYMIQKLFGWQNSHLYNYSLSEADFEGVTAGQNLDEYLKLCGVLFRFPGSELDDRFWDEDYEAEYSIKSWLKSKYTCGYYDLSVENSYLRNREYVKNLKKRYKKATKEPGMTLEKFRDTVVFENAENTVVESLTVRELFKWALGDEYKITIEDWRRFIFDLLDEWDKELFGSTKAEKDAKKTVLAVMQELIDTRKNVLNIRRCVNRGRGKDVKDFYDKDPDEVLAEEKELVEELEKIIGPFMVTTKPKILPFIDELFYSYDYGDDWCVRITCEDAYTASDNYDVSNESIMRNPERIGEYPERLPAEVLTYVDRNGEIVEDEELHEKLQYVYLKGYPVCVMSDGLNVMDDVGGLYGYKRFLKAINNKAPGGAEEREDNLRWARGMGWTGRKAKPENML